MGRGTQKGPPGVLGPAGAVTIATTLLLYGKNHE
jgi:hypothetical protein